MTRILILTNNEKKRRELVSLCPDGVAVDTLKEIDATRFDPVEDGIYFEDNAFRKVRAACRELIEVKNYDFVVADDSGLCVDALDGAPGVFSARFAEQAGRGVGDTANNDFLLTQLADIEDRHASFHCVLAIWHRHTDMIFLLRGTCAGEILRSPQGKNGFGYDPLFRPQSEIDGQKRSMAELTAVEKSAISHRGEAMRRFTDRLPWLLRYEETL